MKSHHTAYCNAPVPWQPVHPWLLLWGQFALILFHHLLFLCFMFASHLLKALLIYLCFAEDRNIWWKPDAVMGSHKSQRIVTSVYCPLSATVDVAPQSCRHETGLCRLGGATCSQTHTHTLTRSCIHSFTQRFKHVTFTKREPKETISSSRFQ